MHAADEVPGGIPPFQELLQRLLRIGEFGAASGVNSIPQGGEHIRGSDIPRLASAARRKKQLRLIRVDMFQDSFEGSEKADR
jgi:hypothetical protein